MPEEIQQRLIEREMHESYLDYAMSVIIARALPDVRDGLKPVHRRILYAMHKMGLTSDKATKKSARIVGEVLGKYHPHGDLAVYDAMVRLAQDFSLRYPLVKGQGNFGSIDGFRAAASRYTEAKLAAPAEELLIDIDKRTVSFIPNYDNTLKEPTVLPAKLPNLLINGSSGIAVGMATNIPPHNLTEVIDALLALIERSDLSVQELLQYIHGPDFPTGGIISGVAGLQQAYATGKGKILVKARIAIENQRLVITEIPYMLNKTPLLENIAELVKNGTLDSISDLRDESDREGLRIVIELKKSADPQLALQQLYAHTSLRSTFSIIMLAIHNGRPVLLTLRDALQYYLDHRKLVITRRTQYELQKAQERDHLVQGLLIALDHIDPVVQLIKQSSTVQIAQEGLMQTYQLTELQAKAILDMRLQRLTSLETTKLKEEHQTLLRFILDCQDILAKPERIIALIKQELTTLKEKYGDARRTEISLAEEKELAPVEELVPEEDVVITLTHAGYIKRIPLTAYKKQKRGGQGVVGTEVKEEDVVKNIFITSNKNYLLLFTGHGKVHWLKAHAVPEGTRYAKGKALVNLLHLEKDESVQTIVPVARFDADHYVFFATKRGLIKKTSLSEFANPRSGGIRALHLRDADTVIDVQITDGHAVLLLATAQGSAVKFKEEDVRSMGRTASGIRGVRLEHDDAVIGLELIPSGCTIFTLTEKGFGKRTEEQEYRLIRRGGKGVTNMKITEKNGKVVGIKTLTDGDEVLCMTKQGIAVRVAAKEISVIGRNTQGVHVMKLKDTDVVTTVAKVVQDA